MIKRAAPAVLKGRRAMGPAGQGMQSSGTNGMVVALSAGAAGMLSIVSSISAALVWVFISVTTVPAAGYAVVAATLGQ